MDGQNESTKYSSRPDVEPRDPSLLHRLESHLWRRVLSGFLVLIPVLITFFILRVVFDYVDAIFRPAIVYWLGEDTPLDFTGFGVVVTLVLLYVIGAFFAGRRFQRWQDAVWSRVPVVRPIYSVARQAVETLASPKHQHFRRVVFLQWPRPGVKALGFVTGHVHADVEGEETVVVVYIPTVPNPTSGMLAWVAETELIETDYTVEEAMKAIFSGGIVLPGAPMRPRLPAGLEPDDVSDR